MLLFLSTLPQQSGKDKIELHRNGRGLSTDMKRCSSVKLIPILLCSGI
jgi:hypothetical protein